ncbi:GNAT family N-acetyltransferase, partial [Miniimonas arenae]|uniref:GNAT family N-acetyltransferase n=3 Tax=Miniimonas TaxID=947525 RepID=UPI0028A9F575
MTAPALTLTDLTTLEDDPALLAATYERVLRPSFTLDELPGPEGVQPNGGHVLTVARDASGEPVGAAFCELDPDGVSLLEYLAVSPASRGLGAGGALLAHLRELWRARGCGLVL